MMDWVVEYFDALEGIVLEEVYTGFSSPAAVNAYITRRLSTDLLMDVAGWTVRAIAVDNVVD